MRVDTAITRGHTSWEVVDFSIIFQVHPCFAEFNLTDEASVGIELSGKRSRGDRRGMRITLHYWWYSTWKLPSRAVMMLTVKIYFRPIRPFFFLSFLSFFLSFLWIFGGALRQQMQLDDEYWPAVVRTRKHPSGLFYWESLLVTRPWFDNYCLLHVYHVYHAYHK